MNRTEDRYCRGKGSPRRMSLAVVLALSVTGLVGCSAQPPSPEEAAGALAKGLSSLDLSAVPFSNVKAAEAGKQLSTAVENMGDLRPKVSVKSIRLAEDDNAATAMFSMTWDVDGSTKDWA